MRRVPRRYFSSKSQVTNRNRIEFSLISLTNNCLQYVAFLYTARHPATLGHSSLGIFRGQSRSTHPLLSRQRTGPKDCERGGAANLGKPSPRSRARRLASTSKNVCPSAAGVGHDPARTASSPHA